MRALAIAAFLALAGVTAAQGATPTPSLQAASAAYFQMRVDEAEPMFRAIVADPGATPRARAAVGRDLARIQWLIDRDAPAALVSLEAARGAGADLCPTDLMVGRVLRESGALEAAAGALADKAGDCPGAVQGDQLALEAARDALAWAAAGDGEVRDAALSRAGAALGTLSLLGALAPEAAALQLELALQRPDATAALAAWKSFFWLTQANAPASFGLADAEVAARFEAALGAAPALADEIALEALLVRGGFYETARRFDANRRVAARAAEAPAYRPVAAYFRFREQFDAATLAFNRAYAHGKGDEAAYRAEVRKILADTAAEVGGGDPATALRTAFGLHWMSGRTGGVESVHMGHVVEDAPVVVEQYGRRGEVRFVSIDNLVSNGYQSWLWDGLAATGGWSELGDVIVQVRQAYTGGPLKALASYDPNIAAKRAQALADAAARDREALAQGGTVFLPALQLRLEDEARAQVADAARDEAARSGHSFERSFLKTFWDAQFAYSITAHEGRHALDHMEFRGLSALSSPELEYRAKLSELELARFPRMPLASILSQDVGGATPHGEADGRIMRGLADWTTAHAADVAGYDAATPAAEQIDKLSDDQLRTAARGLDPYFTEHPQLAGEAASAASPTPERPTPVSAPGPSGARPRDGVAHPP